MAALVRIPYWLHTSMFRVVRSVANTDVHQLCILFSTNCCEACLGISVSAPKAPQHSLSRYRCTGSLF